MGCSMGFAPLRRQHRFRNNSRNHRVHADPPG